MAEPRVEPAIAEVKIATAAAPLRKETWRVPPTASLRQVLLDWASRAGWIVTWDASVDYETVVGNEFSGGFEEAVTELFNAFPAVIKLRAELRTANVPPLLIVTQSRRPLQ